MASILVIDDDQAIRRLLRDLLERAGHDVVEAANGEMGVKLFRDRSFDLTITDILMPVKDGIEVIVELVEQCQGVRILAISAGSRGLEAEFNLKMARDFGACLTLAKPFTRKELLHMVDKALAPSSG